MSRLPLALLSLLLIACSPRGERTSSPEPEEWTRTLPNPFESSQFAAEQYTRVLAQAMDARTHRPVPGAELQSIEVLPRAPRTLPRVLARGKANAFGYALVPVFRERWWMNVVIAPGYAPYAESTIGEVPIQLVAGEDVRIRIFDSLGRPAEGVQAQYYYGAGDGPNLRQPRTDAQGYATLRCIDPSEGFLFPVGPGVSGADIQLYTVPAFDGVRLIHGEPGIVVRGRVLDAGGNPISGACVGEIGWHHGPWTRTDRTGAFRLVGVHPFTDLLRVYRNDEEREPIARLDAPPVGVAIVVRAGVPAEPTERVEIQLTVPGEPGVRPDDVVVCALRSSDGRTVRSRTKGSWGGTYLDLAAGRWELRVAGGVDPYVEKSLGIHVLAGKRNAFVVPVERWPEVEVDIPKLRVGWYVQLTSARAERGLTDVEQRHGSVRLPRDRTVALRVVNSQESAAGYPGCLVRIPEGADLANGVALRAPPAWDWRGALRRFSDRSRRSESFPGTVTVLDAAGAPVEASVWRTYAGGVAQEDTDEDGRAPGGPDGTHVVVHARGDRGPFALLRARLDGDGPWTLRFGAATVRVAVRDEQGRRVSWWGMFPDGSPAEAVEEDVEMSGFEPGLYRLFACAPGTHAVVRQFRLPQGGSRTIRIVLPSSAP